jgi:hypothetical protein
MDTNEQRIISAMEKANTMIRHMEEALSNLDRKLATKFSIFEPTKCDERTMSKIIRLLLDPRGSHGQGQLFLETFLEHLHKSFPDKGKITKFLDRDLKGATVICEACADGRFIDVFVTAGDRKFGIENKLWADDRKDQVKDYLKHVDFLIYLSIDGKLPSSIKLIECKKAIDDGRLLIMQYECSSRPSQDNIPEKSAIADFSDWLKRCEQIAESDKVRWYLREVLQLINTVFYGRSPFMSDSILTEILLKHKDVTEAFADLLDCQNDLTNKLVGNFCIKLKEKFEAALKPLAEEWKMVEYNAPTTQSPKGGGKPIINIMSLQGGVENFEVLFWDIENRNMLFRWNSQNTEHCEKFQEIFDSKGDFHKYGDACKQFPVFYDFRKPTALKKLNEFYHDRDDASELAGVTNDLVKKTILFLQSIKGNH